MKLIHSKQGNNEVRRLPTEELFSQYDVSTQGVPH